LRGAGERDVAVNRPDVAAVAIDGMFALLGILANAAVLDLLELFE